MFTVICTEEEATLNGKGTANELMNIIDICLDALEQQGMEKKALVTILKKRMEREKQC